MSNPMHTYGYRRWSGRTRVSVLAALLASGLVAGCTSPLRGDRGAPEPPARVLGPARQLTFEGARSGEGYFDRDGSALVFQSEREPDNPFYQIYWMDLSTGDVERLSPGHGKTTCAWVHPTGDRVLFASTHDDPDARKKQAEELAERAEGRERRYSWDYDDRYELYSIERPGGALRRLTRARGYDAEASWSPDGDTIVFASNRDAFARDLSQAERERLERDPSYFVDLYRMDADGSVQRLTRTPGYDGGPFFSPDGSRIVWRRFSEDGATAEIYSMALDGGDVRQLTRLGAMSWAPFYHPSGRYLVFTTNLHGFGNFELYLVDVEGAREPLRVTDSEGFDGLPVFAPDGRTLAWTSGRTPDGKSQIFRADWDHAAALGALGLSGSPAPSVEGAAVPPLLPPDPSIGVRELRYHVDVLTSDEMEGRATGSPGEARATAYVASVFAVLGLEPAGDDGTWFEQFDYVAGGSLGEGNALRTDDGSGPALEVDRDWRPLAFSRSGEAPEAAVVFAGYGIVAPESEASPAYDSYADLDVEGKWVLVFRFLPEDLPPERRQDLVRYAGLRYKSTVARDRGAMGLLVVTGPRSQVRDPLVSLVGDVSRSGTSLFAASIRPEIADRMLAPHGDLDALQQALDGGDAVAGFEIPGARVSAVIDLVAEMEAGRNVLARLPGTGPDSLAPVVVGAHLDHLGRGETGGSLARDDERGQIHRGADDNASGVAALLEIAGAMAADPPRRDVVFAAWSGEESGLIGSAHFVKALPAPDFHSDPGDRAISAYLNLDMVGRLRKSLVLFGVGSSPVWKREIERRNVPVGLRLELQDDSYVPSDATSFYLKGVPSLTAFTGAHAEYHTPRDTADRLDYEGMREVARLVRGLADSLASSDELPEYLATERPEGSGGARAFLRAWLGTIPDYAPRQASGLPLSGVMKGGPADEAGVRGGDVIVELAGRRVENIYDYTYAIEALKVGETVRIAVERDGKRLEFDLTPRSRQ